MNENSNKYFEQGSRLKLYAKKNYSSVAGLERKIEVSEKSLSQYISGRNGMGVDLLIKLANDGCDINWLLTGKSLIEKKEEFNNKADLAIKNMDYIFKKMDSMERDIDNLKKEVNR